MALNPNIILQGRGVDVGAAMHRGQALAAGQNELTKTNALRDLYATQGAGIIQGDQNALNALAGIDPMKAHQIQSQQRAGQRADSQLQISQEQLQLAKQRASMEAQRFAASMSSQQAAAEAAKYDKAIAGASQITDEASFDAYMTQMGMDQLVGQFHNKDILIAEALGIKEALEMKAGPKPADEYQRYVQEERAAGRQPMNRIDFKRAGQKTTRTQVGPDGSVSIVEGFGGKGEGPPKLTVDAAKNTGFYIRTQEANKTIEELEAAGTDFWQQSLDAVPFGLGNYGRTPEYQKFDQARRDFVNSILRRESGAVISDSEFDNANKQYFPVPGDSPEVIEQKRTNRRNAIEGLRVGSGSGASYVDGQRVSDFSKMTAEQIGQVDIDGLDAEALEAFSARAEELGF